MVLVIAGLFFMGRESATTVASRFMSALAKQDPEEISKSSFIGTKTPEEAKAAWKKTFEYTKHYAFEWYVSGSSQPDEKNAMVKLQVRGNADSSASYDEKFDLALRKVDGKWLVDVRAISHDMYPALPK